MLPQIPDDESQKLTPEEERDKKLWARFEKTERAMVYISRNSLRFIVLMGCIFVTWLSWRILYRIYDCLSNIL